MQMRAELGEATDERIIKTLEASRRAQRGAEATIKKISDKQKTAVTMKNNLQELAREKREVRLELQKLLATHRDTLEKMHASAVQKTEQFSLYEAVSSIIHWIKTAMKLDRPEPDTEREDLQTAMKTLLDELEVLWDKRASLLARYDALQKDLDATMADIVYMQSSLHGSWGTVAHWESLLLGLQTDLVAEHAESEYDLHGAALQLNTRARLLSEFSDHEEFAWPAVGAIGSGFMDPEYKEFFGFNHQGIDILVNEGTTVRAAAQGVVFGVHEGGIEGYTSVMIGHRGGVATVYGHLRSVSVAGGDIVSRGQEIGKSGGRPGTAGAGKATTGPHLHFELIFLGKHIDPLKIL
jgi:septal ring factor EnvC (AmiA/AmiB activator)